MLGGLADARSDPADAAPQRRGLVCAGALAAGIVGAHTLGLGAHAPFLIFALACCALAWTLPRRASQWSLALAAACLGAGWLALRTQHAPHDALERHLDAHEPRLIHAEGVLRRDPEATQRRGALARFTFPLPSVRMEVRVDTLLGGDGERIPARGLLYVRTDSAPRPDQLRAGDRVRLQGWATSVAPPDNPGAPDMRAWAAQERVAGWARVPTQDLVQRIDAPAPALTEARARFLRLRAQARAAAGGALDHAAGAHRGWGSPESDAILRAILLGEREHALRDVHETFTRLGVAHVLAVSGLHLGIAAWLLLIVLRAVGSGVMRWEALLVALLVLAYLFLVPVRTPIARAAIMTLVFLGAESTGRRYDRMNILGWSMVLTLLWKPMDVFSPGFQLSYLCVGALITFTTPLRLRCFGPPPAPDTVRAPRRMWEGVKDGACACVVAWVVATPVVAHHFGVIAPLGAPLSLLGVPLAAAALATGFLTMLVGVLAPPALIVLAPMVHAPLTWIAHGAAWIDSAPWAAFDTPRVGALLTVAGVLVGAAWLRSGTVRLRAWRLHAATLLLALWTGWSWLAPALGRDVVLRIDMLSVGDGSCLLVRTRDDAFLWDCGSLRISIGEEEVPRALRALGAHRVRRLVVSHPDLDHYSGAVDAARRIGLRTLIVGEAFTDEAAALPRGPVAFTLNTLTSMGVRTEIVRKGDDIPLGALRAEVLWPSDQATRADTTRLSSNDESIILRIGAPTGAGERVLLLTGDAERIALRALLDRPDPPRAHVMEIPHHGSAAYAGIAVPFILAADPDVILQSSGRSRLDDDRWAPVRGEREWLVTARDGAAWVEFLRDGSIRAGAMRAPARTVTPRQTAPAPAATGTLMHP
ncbi:MAG: DUF4131 domain-containing protein [Phycisphaerales bacterium]|nr:MAG: DUF4131 domain-containing protein [Phycisphaerales bacterium]